MCRQGWGTLEASGGTITADFLIRRNLKYLDYEQTTIRALFDVEGSLAGFQVWSETIDAHLGPQADNVVETPTGKTSVKYYKPTAKNIASLAKIWSPNEGFRANGDSDFYAQIKNISSTIGSDANHYYNAGGTPVAPFLESLGALAEFRAPMAMFSIIGTTEIGGSYLWGGNSVMVKHYQYNLK